MFALCLLLDLLSEGSGIECRLALSWLSTALHTLPGLCHRELSEFFALHVSVAILVRIKRWGDMWKRVLLFPAAAAGTVRGLSGSAMGLL